MRLLLRMSLDEDVGTGDLTSNAVVPSHLCCRAAVVTRQRCVVAGLPLFALLVEALQAREESGRETGTLRMVERLDDGAEVDAGQRLCTIAGSARALLAIERTFLNYLSRLSGIATLTAGYVGAVKKSGCKVRVLDTRKTTPGHRVLEKYAVRCGGATNHRTGLYDSVLVKDNHVAAAGGIAEAVRRAMAGVPAGIEIEVECDDLDQVGEAMAAGASALLLDNFTPREVLQAVRCVAGRARLEVSGGVTLDNIAEYARSGVDDISVGSLTHSPPAIDLSMELEVGE